VKQLQGSLNSLAQKPHHALVIAGDFNCPNGASACSAYLAFGSVPATLLEWGRSVSAEVSLVASHGYDGLVSALPSVTQGGDFTYCTSPGNCVDGLDQIWFTSASLTATRRREIFRSSAERHSIATETGLPCAANPSDHLPVGAVFAWCTEDQCRDLSQSCPATSTSLPVDYDRAATTRTAEELFVEAEQLIEACPLTEDERKEFSDVTASFVRPVTQIPPSNAAEVLSDSPVKPRGSRPSNEEIEFYKAQKARRDALLARVSYETRQMLECALRLRKKGEKIRQEEIKHAALPP